MNEGEREIRDPETDRDSGNYEAQGASSAPVAPTREREQTESEHAPLGDDRMDATDRDHREPSAALQNGSSGLLQEQKDQRWQDFAARWDKIQAGFVDDPRRTVEDADRLVAEIVDHLSRLFRDERAKLEAQWSKNGKANTEDLRVAMQRYREFFKTLVGR